MTSHPAIALLEFDSIAVGMRAGDGMAKRAPLATLKAGTVHPGRYLILVGGEVAPVEEAYLEGQRLGEDMLIDKIFLPEVHPNAYAAALGQRSSAAYDTLGVIETQWLPAALHAADAGIKGASVEVLELRLGDGLGGKGLLLLGGDIADVQAGVEFAVAAANEHRCEVRHSVIPSLAEEMVAELRGASRFFGAHGVSNDGGAR